MSLHEFSDTPLDGFQQLQALLSGEKKAPMIEKLGLSLVDVERGRVVFEGTPDRTVYNPMGAVHGGYAATLLDSACGCAVHSRLGEGQTYTTLDLRVSYLKAITDRTGVLRCEGRTVSMEPTPLSSAT